MVWINLAQDKDQWKALVNTVMNLRIPKNAGKLLSSCTTGGFSRRTQLHEGVIVQRLVYSFPAFVHKYILNWFTTHIYIL
jgi:hypothetical protein